MKKIFYILACAISLLQMNSSSAFARSTQIILKDPVKVEIMDKVSWQDPAMISAYVALAAMIVSIITMILSATIAYRGFRLQRELSFQQMETSTKLAAEQINTSTKLSKQQISASTKEKHIHELQHNIAAFLTSTAMMSDISSQGANHAKSILTLTAAINTEKILNHDTKELSEKLKKEENSEEKCRDFFRVKMDESSLFINKIILFLDSEKKLHAELIENLGMWFTASTEFQIMVFKSSTTPQMIKKAQEDGLEIKNNIIEKSKAVIKAEIDSLTTAI